MSTTITEGNKKLGWIFQMSSTLFQIFGGGGGYDSFYLLITLPSLGGLPLTFLLEDLVYLLFSDFSTKASPLPLWLLELCPYCPYLLHFIVDDLLKAMLLVTSFLLDVSGLLILPYQLEVGLTWVDSWSPRSFGLVLGVSPHYKPICTCLY